MPIVQKTTKELFSSQCGRRAVLGMWLHPNCQLFFLLLHSGCKSQYLITHLLVTCDVTTKMTSIITLFRAVESPCHARYGDQECECLPQIYRQYYSTVMFHYHWPNPCRCLFLRGEFTIVSLLGFLSLQSFFLNVASSVLFLLVSSMDGGNNRTKGFHIGGPDQGSAPLHISITHLFMSRIPSVPKKHCPQARFLCSLSISP